MTEVPCIRLGYLTDAQKRAYVIADNKLALNSGWDENMLAIELGDLKDLGFDCDLTGFDAVEIDQVMNAPVTLKEKQECLRPITKTRVLVSIDTNDVKRIEPALKLLADAGCEIDFSGN